MTNEAQMAPEFEAPWNFGGLIAQAFCGLGLAGTAMHEQWVSTPGYLAIAATPFLLKGADLTMTIFHPMTEKKAANTSHFKLALNALIPGAQLLARAVDWRRGTQHYKPA